MTRVPGNHCGVWRIAAALAVALLVVGSMAAERPIESGWVAAELSTAEVLETLGPGPLPLDRPLAGRSIGQTKADTVEDGINQCVETYMGLYDTPGAAVAVLLDGEIIYEIGYGVKRSGETDPVDPETVFAIGSVTKMMTAAAVMQQVELGRVELDAPVTDYIPEFVVGGRWPADRITVWHTLTHTTGFPDRYITDWSVCGDEAPSFWAKCQSGMKLHAPPGSFWNYSNPNFTLAGLVAERASGTPYRDLVTESLWEPAGMNSTTFDSSEARASGNFSHGHSYASEDDATMNRWSVESFGDGCPGPAVPAGGVLSTVGDLVRWALLLMDGGGPVLSSWSASEMQRRQQGTNLGPDFFWGYSVRIDEVWGLDVLGHGGGIGGFRTELLWVPDRRFAVAVIFNSQPAFASEAARCIVEAVLDPTRVGPVDYSTDPLTWNRYTGEYVITDDQGASTEATIYLEGDRLMGTFVDPAVPGSEFTSRLHQWWFDTFYYDSDGDGMDDTEVTFCSTRGRPGYVKWMRNRRAVGERRNTPRSAGRAISP